MLVISRNFPPLWGGMERLNFHLIEELSRCFKVHLIAPEGAAQYVPSSVRVTEVPLRPLPHFLLSAAYCAVREAKTWRPDIVLAGSGLTAPMAWLAAGCCNAVSLAYVHGLDVVVPHPLYRLLWRPVLRRLCGVIANSSATAQLARDIRITQQQISIVHPGVSMPAAIDLAASERFRATHELGCGPILLSVGRLTARKGLREFVGAVLPLLTAKRPDLQLVVIGDVPADALYAEGQSIESIESEARVAGVEKHIRFLGERFGAELEDAYSAANVHVFPVRHLPNDPEGFGMVAVEAAAYGLPTVAYATGGVVDAVGEGLSGRLVESGNATGFAEAVLEMIDSPLSTEKIRAFAEQFSWPRFGERLFASIESLSKGSLEHR